MSTRFNAYSIIFLSLFIAGCVTTRLQPTFEAPSIEKQSLQLLDESVITVKVNDPYDIVKKVEGVVLEDTTRLIFPFHDDGKKGDKEANDGIWSIKVKVPYDSWAGTFTFKITAYNVYHEAIIIHDELNEVAQMSTTMKIEIQQPKPELEVPVL
jgi:hypothetical protein